MSRYTITIKDNETDYEKVIKGDNILLAHNTKIKNEDLYDGGSFIGGEYTACARAFVTLGKNLHDVLIGELTDEQKEKIKKFREEKK